MAILIHRDPMIKPNNSDDYDHALQSVSEFNEINQSIPIYDPDCLNILVLSNNDDTYYFIGILISLAGIYYFIHEIIKKVSG